MDEDENEETTPVSNFFSKRAKFVPKVSAEALKAATELINQIQKEQVPPKTQKSQVQRVPTDKTIPRKKKDVPDIDELLVEESHKEEVVVKSPSVPEVELSSAAKRRLKKLERERMLELRRIELDNEKVLSTVSTDSTGITEITYDEVPIDEDFDELTVLTISYMSEISRVKCYKTEKFSAIFPRIAELFKLEVSEFLLCHRENNIAVDDTPESLNIKSCDILDCIPYKADKNTESNDDYDENKLKIFFQTSYDKEKIDIVVHKLEKMQNIMDRYSKLKDLPLNEFAFEFDGERITGSQTAEDLDMETGNCIDVIVFNPSSQIASSKKRTAASSENCAASSSGNSAAASLEDSITILSESSNRTSPRKRAPAAKKRAPAAKKRAPAAAKKRAPAAAKKRAPAQSRRRSPRKKKNETVVTLDSDSRDTDIILSETSDILTLD